jgi:hypothetical protein
MKPYTREFMITTDIGIMHGNGNDETSIRLHIENEYAPLSNDEERLVEEHIKLHFN